MKRCSRCYELLPESEFHRLRSKTADGLQRECKDCRRKARSRRTPGDCAHIMFGPHTDRRRFPIDPLLLAMGARARDEQDGVKFERAAADVFGVRPQTIQTWRRRGLRWPQADEVAVAAGFHPADIWPNWFDQAC